MFARKNGTSVKLVPKVTVSGGGTVKQPSRKETAAAPCIFVDLRKHRIEKKKRKKVLSVSLENALSAVTILVSTIIAVGICTKLYHQYQFIRTVSSVMDVYAKKTEQIPNATICLPFDAKELDVREFYYQLPPYYPETEYGNGFGNAYVPSPYDVPTIAYPVFNTNYSANGYGYGSGNNYGSEYGYGYEGNNASVSLNGGGQQTFGQTFYSNYSTNDNGYGFGYGYGSPTNTFTENTNETINWNYSGYGNGNILRPNIANENSSQTSYQYIQGLGYENGMAKKTSEATVTNNPKYGYGFGNTMPSNMFPENFNHNANENGPQGYSEPNGNSFLPNSVPQIQPLPNYGGYGFGTNSLNVNTTVYTDELQRYLGGPREYSARYFFNYQKREPWSPRVLYIAHKYLAVFQEIEELRQGAQNPFCNDADSTDNHANDEWAALTQVLVQKMVEWNVSLNEFREKFSEQLFMVYTLEIAQTNSMSTKSVFLAPHSFSYVEKSQACMEVALDSVNNDMTSLLVQVDREFLPNRQENFDRPVTIYIAGRQQQTNQHPIIAVPFGGDYRIVTLTSVNMLNVLPDNQRCSKEKSLANCQAECRNDIIEEICGCSSSTLYLSKATTQKKKPECSLDQYSRCLANFTGDEDNDCTKSCVDSCKQWQYFLDEHNLRTNPEFGNYKVNVEIVFRNLKYVILEETYAWSVEEFISAICGVLCLFVSLNLIYLLQLAGKKIALILHKFEPNQKKTRGKGEKLTERENKRTKPLHSTFTTLLSYAKAIKYRGSTSLCSLTILAATSFIAYIIEVRLAFRVTGVLHESYKGNSSFTSVRHLFNTTLRLPPATICLTFAPENLQDWGKFDSFTQFWSLPTIYAENLKEYLNETDRETLFANTPSNTWPIVMTYVSYMYLYGMEAAERETEKNGVDLEYGFFNKYLSTAIYSTDYEAAKAARAYLIPTIKALNITNQMIRQKFINEFVKLHSLEISFQTATEKVNLLVNPMAKSIERDMVCFEVGLDGALFTKVTDYIDITVNRSSLPKSNDPSYSLQHSSTISKQRNLLTVNFDYDNHDSSDSELSFAYGENCKSFLYIGAQYKSLEYVENQHRCSGYQNMADCIAECRINLIEQLCNCSATSWPKNLSKVNTLEECSYERYENCLYYDGKDDKACRQTCRNACVRWSFIRETHTESFESKNLTRMRISVGAFSYPVFQETFMWTKEAILTANGSIWSTFEDLNYISFISLIFTLCASVFGIYCQMKENEEDKDVNFTRTANHSKIRESYLKLLTKICMNTNTMRISKNRLLVASFWAAIYFTCGCLCLLLCIQLYRQNNNTSPSLKLELGTNESLILQSTTVCVPLSLTKFDEFAMNGSVLQDRNFYSNYAQKLFYNMTKETLFRNENWPAPLLRIMHSYFRDFDCYLGDNIWDSLYDTNQDKPKISSDIRSADLFGAKDSLIGRFFALNISNTELKQKFLKEMLKVYKIEASHIQESVDETKTTNESLLKPRTVLVFQSKICYEFPTKNISLNQRNEQIRFKVNRSIFSSNPLAEEASLPVSFTFAGFNEKGSRDILLESSVLLNFSSNLSAVLSKASVHRAAPLLNQPERCGEESSRRECHLGCRRNALEGICKCSLGSLSSKENSTYKECNWSQVINCNSTAILINATICADGCNSSCEQIHYTAKKIRGTPVGPDQAQIQFQIDSMQYPQFTQASPWSTMERLIGALGGLCSIFLGANLLALVFMIFRATLLATNVAFKKKKVNTLPTVGEGRRTTGKEKASENALRQRCIIIRS